jgi:ribosomal protein S18 acetylase RimI-like enzyme
VERRGENIARPDLTFCAAINRVVAIMFATVGTSAASAAGRGVASAMCRDSLERAAAAGFRAMQFNFFVSTNERAVNLWKRFGFEIVGRLPSAFLHPALGYVDAFVMFRSL